MGKKLAPPDRGRLHDLTRCLAEHTRLANQLAALATQRTQLAAHRDQRQQTMQALVTQHATAKNDAERLKKAYATRVDVLTQLQSRVADYEQRIRRRGLEASKLSGKRAALDEQLAELQDQIAKQQLQLRKLAAQVGVITENKLELARQRAGIEAEAEKARRVMAAYHAALAGVDKPLASLKERLLLLGDSQDPGIAKQRAVLQGRIATLKSQRETIVLRGRGRYVQAGKAIHNAAARVSDLDGEIQRLDAERTRPARRYRTLDSEMNDNLGQLAILRSQRDQVAARLARLQAAMAADDQQRDASAQQLERATADRNAARGRRDDAVAEVQSLARDVRLATADHAAAVSDHQSADAGHNATSIAVAHAAGNVVTALADAVGVAGNVVAAIQNGAATFGNGLPKVPTVIQTALAQLDIERGQLATALTHIAPLDIANAPTLLQPLTRLFDDIDVVITAFNAEVDRTPRALNDEFETAKPAITQAAKSRCTSDGEYNNAAWVDNQLKQQQNLRDRVADFLSSRKNACLQNPVAEQAALLTDVDELLRRYRIFLLRAKYNQMCFTERVPPELRTCLANAVITPAAAELRVRNLRLQPTIGELRQALGVPTGGGWTISGPTSKYDGVEIHVTVSADSIQLPNAAINTYLSGAALFNAMFILPGADSWKEVHATLNVAINANGQHPAVFVGGQDKFWDQYRQYRQNTKGDNLAVAQQREQAARAAVQALLDQWVTGMRPRCQTLIGYIAQSKDVLGKPLP